MPSLTVDAAGTDARSLELNALKTKNRAIYANFRNVAQKLFWHIFSLIIPEIFMQKTLRYFEDIEYFVEGCFFTVHCSA